MQYVIECRLSLQSIEKWRNCYLIFQRFSHRWPRCWWFCRYHSMNCVADCFSLSQFYKITAIKIGKINSEFNLKAITQFQLVARVNSSCNFARLKVGRCFEMLTNWHVSCPNAITINWKITIGILIVRVRVIRTHAVLF